MHNKCSWLNHFSNLNLYNINSTKQTKSISTRQQHQCLKVEPLADNEIHKQIPTFI